MNAWDMKPQPHGLYVRRKFTLPEGGGKYLMKINSNEAGCIMKSVNYTMNINTLENDYENRTINMNDIANVTIKTSKPIFFDSYKVNNITGSMIFIDEGTNETVAAGMII
jgi:sulfate adenylyltransferase subunit 1